MARAADVAWFLTVDVRAAGAGQLVLALAGRLGKASADDLARAIAGAIDSGKKQIFLDLSGVDYISSAAIESIEIGRAAAVRTGGSLALTGASAAVALTLDLAGVELDVMANG
jgi:anti-anti-sigma factor